MKTFARHLLLAAGVPLLLAACAGGGGTTWTFSPPVATSPAASPGGSGSPGASPSSPLPSGPSQSSPPASGSPDASPSGSPGGSPGGTVVELAGTATLQWQQNGQPVTSLTVPAGQPVTFRVDNQAGFDHNFYIGEGAALSQGDTSEAEGIETWQSGVREMTYTFEEGQNLEFACIVPGHYGPMHGTFTIQP